MFCPLYQLVVGFCVWYSSDVLVHVSTHAHTWVTLKAPTFNSLRYGLLTEYIQLPSSHPFTLGCVYWSVPFE